MKIATLLFSLFCLCHHGASAQDYLNNPYFNFVPANEQFPITSYVQSFPNEPIGRDNPAAWTGSGIISYEDEEDQFLPGKLVDRRKMGFGPRRRKKRELLDCATTTKTKDSTSLLSKVIRSNMHKIYLHSFRNCFFETSSCCTNFLAWYCLFLQNAIPFDLIRQFSTFWLSMLSNNNRVLIRQQFVHSFMYKTP